ncbi:WD repeat-containing protein 18 [Mactra antiquata]
MEVLITSDISGQLWNACIWDINTGTSLTSYKGESTNHRGLCILGNQYLLGASCTKPLIHVWALQRREQHHLKIICPGKVTALTVSKDGTYCVAAAGEKLHIWQVCTGNLLAVLSRHYQTVNVVRFTDNGSHFISGGEDNLIIVWSISSIMSSIHNHTRKPDPVRIWSNHSLPITDLYVGKGGSQARVVSSSLDQTCKIWDMVSGELLHTIIFPCSIMSVTMDTAEYRMISGGSNGDIYCVNMYGQPIRKERHIDTQDNENVTCFKGHSKQVTCLSISMDGTKLVSGSHDSSVKIWDIFSGQCLRSLPHKGPISNAMIIPTPPAVHNPEIKPTMPLQAFKRNLYTGDDSEGYININLHNTCNVLDQQYTDLTDLEEKQSKESNIETLTAELHEVKAKNKDLYLYTINEILHNKDG